MGNLRIVAPEKRARRDAFTLRLRNEKFEAGKCSGKMNTRSAYRSWTIAQWLFDHIVDSDRPFARYALDKGIQPA